MKNLLPVSETFFSIQGEAVSAGQPSLFMRLGGCNLLCNGSWVCDTIPVWKKFQKKTFDEICSEWEEKKWISRLKDRAHLIITGGEPMLHKKILPDFRDFFVEKYKFYPYTEIETNGTIIPENNLFYNQLNVSPKLSNSGMPRDKRYIYESLRWFSKEAIKHAHCIFKFVVTSTSDWDEISNDFINQFSIPNNRVWLMPGADTTDKLNENTKKVAELAIEKNVNFSSRLQVAVWGKVTGV